MLMTKPHVLLAAIPPSFFSIPMGLAGLAGVWRLAAGFSGFPQEIGDAFYVITAAMYLLLIFAFFMKLVRIPGAVVAELTDPILGPFYALLPMGGMLLALGLQPYTYRVALILFVVFFITTVLLGGWMTGQWIVAKLDANVFHPGYLLPTVAGCLLAADGAAHFGLMGPGWMSFGIGLICWLVLGSVTLNRLFFQPDLPPGLVPTLAIEVAPAVVASNAYFSLTNGRIDTLAYALAGYAVLMVLVQLRLVPLYLKTPFVPGFWAFTFSYAAVASNAIYWINVEHPIGEVILIYTVLAAITLFVLAIAFYSLVAIKRGTFLPTSYTFPA